jgi:cyanophycinase
MFACLSVFFADLAGADTSIDNIRIYRVGAEQDSPSAHAPEGGALLKGGGGDVDDGYRWLIERGGGGDFLVLRTTQSDVYNDYIYALGGVASVTTIAILNRAGAMDPRVAEQINRAEIIFLAGGDQSTYVNNWNDTPVEEALNARIAAGVPIGGTSAGLAVLGNYVYSALFGSATSDRVLANPFDMDVTLARNFLEVPHLGNVITDSHFRARDRMGRLVGFLARLQVDGWASPGITAIAVDEATALKLETLGEHAGVGTVLGEGSVYFIRTPPTVPTRCEEGSSLTFRDLTVSRLELGGQFNLAAWQPLSSAVAYTLSAEDGVLVAPRGVYGELVAVEDVTAEANH